MVSFPAILQTNHSHVNYYVDMTAIKTSSTIAKKRASLLAQEYMMGTNIDTIVCLEGTEMLGAFLAQALSDASIPVLNAGHDINVITPELNASNQMIFRITPRKKFGAKMAATDGASFYGQDHQSRGRMFAILQWKTGGDCSGFSARGCREPRHQDQFHLLPNDLPEYQSYGTGDCPLCAARKKIDAIVNSYGYSKI